MSLFAKIAFSLTLLFTGAVFTLGYLILIEQNNNFKQEREKLVYSSAKTLAEGSIDALISGDFEVLEQWLKAVTLTDVYAYGYLSGPNGHILVHTDPDMIAKYAPAIKPFYKTTSRTLTYKDQPVKEVIYSSMLGDELFANAHIAYYNSENIFSAFKREGIYIILAVMFSFLVLILLATLYIIRLHTKPLAKLSHSIQHFTFDENEYEIDKSLSRRPDEIGALAAAFQLMTQRLSNAYQELKHEEQNLQAKVEQRTEDLLQQNQLLTEMQEQLVQSEKMASLGNLVSGIAHEINTPVGIYLTAVTHLNDACLEIYKKYDSQTLTQDEFLQFLELSRESCQMSVDNIGRAAGIISNFKQIAVDQHYLESNCFTLYEYLNDILQALNPELKKHNDKVLITGDSSLKIKSNQGLFYQIFSNLVMNSLIHGFEDIDDGEINIEFETKQDYLLIKYSDNGSGVSKEILDNIFEPFITTKRGQGGSGLGAHIIYNLVVQRLKGTIECLSEPGKGILFSIVFPVEKCS